MRTFVHWGLCEDSLFTETTLSLDSEPKALDTKAMFQINMEAGKGPRMDHFPLQSGAMWGWLKTYLNLESSSLVVGHCPRVPLGFETFSSHPMNPKPGALNPEPYNLNPQP